MIQWRATPVPFARIQNEPVVLLGAELDDRETERTGHLDAAREVEAKL